MKQKDLTAEMVRRQAEKWQEKVTKERRKLERKLKNVNVDNLDEEHGND